MTPIPPSGYFRRSCALLFSIVTFIIACTHAEAARGRPYLNAAKTTFVADNGNLLRGAIISTEKGVVPPLADFLAIKNYGLNAVHCYGERSDYGYAAGTKVAALDAVVQLTRDNGLYLIITVGGGGVNATFNSAFWNFYAGRYANETHVIYEIQNEPAYGAPYSSAVITMEKNNYNIIRAAAPNTPVLLMSYMIFQNGPGVLTDIAALGSTVNWNNAAIGFHGYGENGTKATLACLKAVLAAGYPCFQTEYYRWPWGLGNFGLGQPASLYEDVDEMADLERLGVSWLSFLGLQRVTEDFRFKDRIRNAGILWNPDFGTWPSGTRSIFGNSGEPRAIIMSGTTRIQAEDFDNGGQGIAYNDTTSGNSGGQYRTGERVDIEATADTGGGHNIGWLAPGEWTEYTVYVQDPGTYALKVRVASAQTTNSFSMLLGGSDLTGTWSFAGTGGNQIWTTLSKTVTLTPGQQVLRLSPLSAGFKINWIELTPAASGVIANGTYRIVNRNSGKAMDVAGASTANGAKILQYTYAGSSNQKWVFIHKGANQYTITSLQTGKAIDEEANNNLSGDFIAMWPLQTNRSGQRWLVTPTDSGYYKLVSANSGLVLEVISASTANAAIVQQWEFGGGNHQQWKPSAP